MENKKGVGGRGRGVTFICTMSIEALGFSAYKSWLWSDLGTWTFLRLLEKKSPAGCVLLVGLRGKRFRQELHFSCSYIRQHQGKRLVTSCLYAPFCWAGLHPYQRAPRMLTVLWINFTSYPFSEKMRKLISVFCRLQTPWKWVCAPHCFHEMFL